MMREEIVHPFDPVVDASCRVLILGSFPSVQSRADGFYYGHPRNRFWPLLCEVFHEDMPATHAEKKHLLLSHHLGLWDVCAQASIAGSMDASIRNAVPVDIHRVLDKARIDRILCNGKLAGRLYEKYLLPCTGLDAVCLPSTSPANAAWSAKRLTDAWSVIREVL